jgi:hypothetical protein
VYILRRHKDIRPFLLQEQISNLKFCHKESPFYPTNCFGTKRRTFWEENKSTLPTTLDAKTHVGGVKMMFNGAGMEG